MNLLWIMADQMRGDCLGCLGHPVVQTPQLDALAARGTAFEAAYAQAPICTPSRVCCFSGRYVHAHGAWWNGVPVSRPRVLLPQLLRSAGYHTGLIGKLHFLPQAERHGFDYSELHEEKLPVELSAYAQFLRRRKPAVTGAADCTEWSDPAASVGICHLDEELEETRWAADRACRFLEQQSGAPFFLFVSFIRPHSPYNPLPRFARRYADADIPEPEFNPSEWDRLPPRIRATAASWGWDRLSREAFVEVRRHYYALCSQVDENVGRVLGCLAERGLADDTIVVFSSDHGDFLGQHGVLYKEHLWDGALHVPLIIADPRRRSPVRYAGLVETVDIFPTLLELLEFPIAAEIQGRSLLHVLESPAELHKDAVFAEFASYTVNRGVHDVLDTCVDPNIVSVRTASWKYIHYAGEAGELYDIRKDPGERHNRFADPGTREIRGELQELLLNWRLTSNDNCPPARDNPYFSTLFGR